MSGRIVAICIGPEAGVALVTVESAALEAGRGIVGDRYYERRGGPRATKCWRAAGNR